MTATFVWGPEKIEKYPLEPGLWRNLSIVLLVVAGVLGIAAMVLVSMAAIGLPKSYETMTGPDLEVWTQGKARSSISLLHYGIACAAIAGVAIVSLTTWLLVAAATKNSPPTTIHAVVKDDDALKCGKLVRSGDHLVLSLTDSSSISPPGTLLIVADCP